MGKFLFSLVLSILTCFCYAQEQLKPLPPEQAFDFSAHLQGKQLVLHWTIAPGYYLYRDLLHIDLAPASPIKLGHIILPAGITRHDTVRGTYSIYQHNLKIIAPLLATHKTLLILHIGYQGCSSQGFCYSPIKKQLRLDLASSHALPTLLNVPITSGIPAAIDSSQSYAEKVFAHQSLTIIILSFLGLGLLLAFTPCVLPMVPILSGIIIGHRRKSSSIKTFSLSLAYVLGMAMTYAVAGMIVALAGSRLQTELQRPWVIGLFSGIFVLLALSLFGWYEFKLPVGWQKRLTNLSNQQKSGTYLGVFLMGSISSLIVSPCISPALVGVLTYIAHTGNIWIGALALLALGTGMGLPLLLVGASVGKLLPQTGAWMQTIEQVVGIIMLAFAIWLLARIIPGSIALFLWSALLISAAIAMGKFSQARHNKQYIRHGLSSVILIYGIILLIGAALGNDDPLHPWENWQRLGQIVASQPKPGFTTVNTLTQLNREFATAKQEKKWVLLDFSASWCEACIRMERYVFSQPRVIQNLAGFILLRADTTADNNFDRTLMRQFQVIAPPTLLFFTPSGKELMTGRIIGAISAEKLLAHIKKIKEISRAD
jgi:thiol:disulfide interchange protein DsbD